MNNNIFFTITNEENGINFNSTKYKFTITLQQQELGTKGNCLWYFNFGNESLELKWISWNQNSNQTKKWEYLLLKVNDTLYSGFINKSKTQDNIFYSEIKPLPKKDEELIFF